MMVYPKALLPRPYQLLPITLLNYSMPHSQKEFFQQSGKSHEFCPLKSIYTIFYFRLSPNSTIMLLIKSTLKASSRSGGQLLGKSKCLGIFQGGFWKNHSTQSALIKLTDVIRMGKENKLVTLLVQFDFSKAFDNVFPSKLLRKLQLFLSHPYTSSGHTSAVNLYV